MSWGHGEDKFKRMLPNILQGKTRGKKTLWDDVQMLFYSSAVCVEMCQNGGTCVAPETCACLPGYTGMKQSSHCVF